MGNLNLDNRFMGCFEGDGMFPGNDGGHQIDTEWLRKVSGADLAENNLFNAKMLIIAMGAVICDAMKAMEDWRDGVPYGKEQAQLWKDFNEIVEAAGEFAEKTS
jgi:hypothetical protein